MELIGIVSRRRRPFTASSIKQRYAHSSNILKIETRLLIIYFPFKQTTQYSVIHSCSVWHLSEEAHDDPHWAHRRASIKVAMIRRPVRQDCQHVRQQCWSWYSMLAAASTPIPIASHKNRMSQLSVEHSNR